MGNKASSRKPPKYQALEGFAVPVEIQANGATLMLPPPPDMCFMAKEWPELAAALGESRVSGMTIHRTYKKTRASLRLARVVVQVNKEYWTFRNHELDKIESLNKARQNFAMNGSCAMYARSDKMYEDAIKAFNKIYLY